MRYELSLYDKTATFNDLSRSLFIAVQAKFDYFCIPAGLIQTASEFREHIKLSAAVDYPYGLEVTNVRLNSINEAIKRGASSIDLTINSAKATDKSFKAIAEDVIACRTLCKARDVSIRAMIEYRLLEDETILELCSRLTKCGIEEIVTSTGDTIDDPLDNIIMSELIINKTNMGVVAHSRWNQSHHELCKGVKLTGIRFNSAVVVQKLWS